MGSLPPFRICERKAPFTSVAIDFFGNLQIKINRNTNIKGSVITCMTTRSTHLELCCTVDRDAFVRAWRRFTAVGRVHPNHVFTDGGGTFKGANKPISEWVLNWDLYLIQNKSDNGSRAFFRQCVIPTVHFSDILRNAMRY